jgi:mannose-6-phosphate isomerase-like protein (cupin superfamily)
VTERSEVTPEQLLGWVNGYERAWRTAGTDGLRDLFTDDAEYLGSPYDKPVVGLAAISRMWDEDRNGPDEVFTMTTEVVACQGSTGVARVQVRYGDPLVQEYLDLWVVRFAVDGRADRFEEWPFWPTHGRAPARTEPVVLGREDVPSGRYAEWVRSQSLSAGVYRIAAGGVDDQSPHREDEVYVVTAGAAALEVEGRRTPVRPGTVAFVPRRADHRFVDVTADLEVSVVFAPPESDGSGAED